MLIDIALPYTYHNHSRQNTTVLARYLLFGHKLIGIKVCGCKDWPVDKVERESPSAFLQKFYRENSIPFALNEIQVGNFYLQF